MSSLSRRLSGVACRAVLIVAAISAVGFAVGGASTLAATGGRGLVGSESRDALGSRVIAVRAAVGSLPKPAPGSHVVGALAGSTPISVTITLKPRDPAALAAYTTAVSTPGSAVFRRYLTTAQFAAQFGATPEAIGGVEASLHSHGLHPSPVSSNGLSIRVGATAAEMAKVFSTSFVQLTLKDGRKGYANVSAPEVDASIAPHVESIVGLESVNRLPPLPPLPGHPVARRAFPQVVTGGPQPCAAASGTAAADGGLTADQVASAYRYAGLYGAGDLGAGQSIGIFELEGNFPSDVTAFESCYGISTNVTYQEVDGGPPAPSRSMGDGSESALDIEDIASLVPAANIVVYQAPFNTFQNWLDDLSAMIAASSRPSVISVSYGLCEAYDQQYAPSGFVSSENTLFQEAATQGQSVLVSSGDSGSEECDGTYRGTGYGLGESDPASQPFVTAVGGTTVSSVGPPPTETVWNWYPTFGTVSGARASGGGISSNWTMPSYQSGATASLGVLNPTYSSGTPCRAPAGSYCREVPDIAADGDPNTGYAIYYNGWTQVGGTSGSAPTLAALIALSNASGHCDGTMVGFVNPSLYMSAGLNYSGLFNDITSGNNDADGTESGLYPALAGYDLATGLGTPNGGALAAALCAGTPPASTSPPAISGRAQQGQTLTESHGSWTNSPTGYAYQWQDCDSSGDNCSAIAGANAQSYVLTGSDVGHTIRVQETASNAGGSSSPASSAATAVVLPLAPANVSPPSISGNTTQGQRLTESHGPWTNSPTGYAYQWQDCDSSGDNCSAIAGANAQSYVLTGSDVGHTIRVQETASNAGGGSSPASSAATGVVQPRSIPTVAPSNNSAPVISGMAKAGHTVSASTGSWSGSPPISYAYQWQRCSPGCVNIAGATASSLVLSAADVGHKLRVVVTATNSAGSAPALSSKFGPIAAPPPPGQIKAAVSKAMAVTGNAAKIAQLLKHGGYVLSFTAPSAGRLVISWYFLPKGAHLAKANKPVLVATASVIFHHAGRAKAKIALTSKGRQLLKTIKQLKLTVQGSFTPTGETTISTTKPITLKR